MCEQGSTLTSPVTGNSVPSWRSNIKVHLQGCCEEYAVHLADKVACICSVLDFSLKTESMEVEGATSCKVEEEFELVEPEDRIQLLVWPSYAEDTQLYDTLPQAL